MLANTQAEFATRHTCINCGSTDQKEMSRGRYVDEPLRSFLEADPWGENPMPHLQEAEWVLVQCKDCSQVFHQRILDEKWNERRFSHWMSAEAIREFEKGLPTPENFRHFEAGRAYAEHILRLEILTRRLRGTTDAVRLLDFGCGWGAFVSACRLFGFDAVGVDRSAPRASGASVAVFQSLDDIPDQRPFHAITLFETLEHLDRPAEVLHQLSKRIVSGGILILETPDCAGVIGIRTHDDFRKVHPLEHINAFTHQTMVSIAARNGFSLIKKPPAVVAASYLGAARKIAKAVLRRDEGSTRLYFTKN